MPDCTDRIVRGLGYLNSRTRPTCEAARVELEEAMGITIAVDPCGERLYLLRLVVVGNTSGKIDLTYICERVVTGNEYRLWQQSGNVPPIEVVDAGSSPAAHTISSPNVEIEQPPTTDPEKS